MSKRLPFQCGFCRDRIGAWNARGVGGLPKSNGGISRVHLTGRRRLKKTKLGRGVSRARKLLRFIGEYRRKHAARGDNWLREYICHDCGTIGWSDHPDLKVKGEAP